ncbi:predicted protein [Aspergillus nidulans FGSC A4]|uniref:Uncharacterized protein n=1 Tax=Emericella nidulans (strain FGSC A4 / ATCC 38163 / CBS 112.46 / NRRL 194 / M139) TaxID=227321 RepID=Q5AXV3_EMENI|nr:hypothetical protein [Aspergillus nidulans FGSC A4]EAA58276.1 predicted protein [Aspergillus nidulans FGSC A4]CBF71644.1 TPA: conserved hypothetical protein [Aspergillus nidulans FGSC A4]|eukprot:XP_664481.1 predicted protein [Aspergillus nidulans FGSC A4]
MYRERIFIGPNTLWDGFEHKQTWEHPICVPALCSRGLRWHDPPWRARDCKDATFSCKKSQEGKVCVQGVRTLSRPEDKVALEPYYNDDEYTNPCSVMAIYHAEHVSISSMSATDVISDQARKLWNCPELCSQALRSVGVEDKLLQRVNQLESQLQRLLAINNQSGSLKPPSRPGFVCGAETSSILSSHNQPTTPPDDTAHFVGEISMVHTLNQVENHFQRVSTTNHSSSSVQSIQPTQSPHLRIKDGPTRLMQSEYLKCVLKAHSVIPDRAHWNGYLQAYVDDVHVL